MNGYEEIFELDKEIEAGKDGSLPPGYRENLISYRQRILNDWVLKKMGEECHEKQRKRYFHPARQIFL